ncbi:MAG TPA: tetratricopeptide repeat protein [Gemmatimonadaceae bacterium]|jgi:tetratricopeptide (TPR) repeat protein|nr:tetratricopeptide repeat protein [Gemmatimonadaceae bacterium]
MISRPSVVVSLFGLAVLAVPIRGQSVEQGVQLFNLRKYADAKVVLLPYGERDADAAYYLGRIEMESDDDGKAAEWFERAVKMNPKSAVYYDWLGRAYGTQAQHANAFRLPFLARKTKNAWETALAIDPDNLDVRDDLIIFYTRAPGFVGGNKEKARAMAVEIRNRNPYRGSIAAANLCAADKDTVCVERELEGMVTTYPDSAAVYATLAAFYANQKRFDKAFTVLDERLRAKPNEPTALYQVGRTASLSGQNLDQGEQAFKTLLAEPTPGRGPAPASIHYRLGMIYEKKGAKDLAREEYRATLQLQPSHQEAKKALAALR